MTQARRATDSGEPTNAEVQSAIERRIGRLEDKFDSWIKEHREDHRKDDERFEIHLRDAVGRDHEIDNLEKLSPEVAALHDFRIKVETMAQTIQVISSVLGRVQWGVVIAVLLALAAFVIEAFVPHVSGVPVLKP